MVCQLEHVALAVGGGAENALLSSRFAVVVGTALWHRNAGTRKVNSMTVNYRSMSLN